jgi:hypothetical protein
MSIPHGNRETIGADAISGYLPETRLEEIDRDLPEADFGTSGLHGVN